MHSSFNHFDQSKSSKKCIFFKIKYLQSLVSQYNRFYLIFAHFHCKRLEIFAMKKIATMYKQDTQAFTYVH